MANPCRFFNNRLIARLMFLAAAVSLLVIFMSRMVNNIKLTPIVPIFDIMDGDSTEYKVLNDLLLNPTHRSKFLLDHQRIRNGHLHTLQKGPSHTKQVNSVYLLSVTNLERSKDKRTIEQANHLDERTNMNNRKSYFNTYTGGDSSKLNLNPISAHETPDQSQSQKDEPNKIGMHNGLDKPIVDVHYEIEKAKTNSDIPSTKLPNLHQVEGRKTLQEDFLESYRQKLLSANYNQRRKIYNSHKILQNKINLISPLLSPRLRPANKYPLQFTPLRIVVNNPMKDNNFQVDATQFTTPLPQNSKFNNYRQLISDNSNLLEQILESSERNKKMQGDVTPASGESGIKMTTGYQRQMFVPVIQTTKPSHIGLDNTMAPEDDEFSHYTVRADQCTGCFKRPYRFIINSPEVCHGLAYNTNGEQTLDLLIFITSSFLRKEKRDAIRQTWASVTNKNHSPRVRYVFLLGHTNDVDDTELSIERRNHKDIIMQDFIDSYRNLTLKTLMALEWREKYCRAAKYIMKTDDDVYVKVNNILNSLLGDDLFENSIFGWCTYNAQPFRTPESKWYVSLYQYPHYAYPGFCSGTGYLMPRNVAHRLLKVSANIPFFFLEDVYVSLCANSLDIRLQHVNGFNNEKVTINYIDCDMYGGHWIYTSHRIEPYEMSDIWQRCK